MENFDEYDISFIKDEGLMEFLNQGDDHNQMPFCNMFGDANQEGKYSSKF